MLANMAYSLPAVLYSASSAGMKSLACLLELLAGIVKSMQLWYVWLMSAAFQCI